MLQSNPGPYHDSLMCEPAVLQHKWWFASPPPPIYLNEGSWYTLKKNSQILKPEFVLYSFQFQVTGFFIFVRCGYLVSYFSTFIT